MKNTKVLEMLNDGKIEELKALLQDEIFAEGLKGNGNAKKRYSAMKKYFTYTKHNNPALNIPCVVKETYKDHIIITDVETNTDLWIEEHFNMDCVYPDYHMIGG